jgi:ATP-binding protein involved in chromosome partitioning
VAGAKRVIAVSSNKGGVGKSTVAVNLAFSLKNLGKKVGLLDADIYGPSMPMLLNKREAKPGATSEKKILPIDAYGIPFISFGLFINEKDPVIWRGPMLGGVLNQFLFDVAWTDLDYLIIDLPPGTGDMQLSMVQATEIDGVIVVSTPQDVAILDSRKGLNMFNQVKIPILGMVENMSYFVPDDAPQKKYFIFGEGGVKKAAAELNVNLLAEIPLELALREGSDKGQPYMNEKKYEGRPVWNAYMTLAKNIEHSFNDSPKEGEQKGFFKRLFS